MIELRNLWKLWLIRWRIILLVVAYLAAVFMIARLWSAPGMTELQYVASKKLIRNRRLMTEDIKEPSSGPGHWGWFLPNRAALEGRYVIDEIPQTEGISIENLSASPDMQFNNCLRPVIFSLDTQPQLAQFLNAQSTVDVIGTDPNPLVKSVKVHAVVCENPVHSDKTLPPCYAILATSPYEESTIGSRKEKLRLALTGSSQ